MVDGPMLFAGAMVRAMLDGRKTRTRRVLTPQPIGHVAAQPLISFNHGVAEFSLGPDDRKPNGDLIWRRLPSEGDRFWVRETWAVGRIYDGVKPRHINPQGIPQFCGVRYAATDERLGIKDRPSIHMPRWASRITLTVTDMRVQRLQDLSEDDAIAEGLIAYRFDDPDGETRRRWHWLDDVEREDAHYLARDAFAALWNSLNGDGAWEANPWVVETTFQLGRHNIDNDHPVAAPAGIDPVFYKGQIITAMALVYLTGMKGSPEPFTMQQATLAAIATWESDWGDTGPRTIAQAIEAAQDDLSYWAEG